jgi:hypothetical protein
MCKRYMSLSNLYSKFGYVSTFGAFMNFLKGDQFVYIWCSSLSHRYICVAVDPSQKKSYYLFLL